MNKLLNIVLALIAVALIGLVIAMAMRAESDRAPAAVAGATPPNTSATAATSARKPLPTENAPRAVAIAWARALMTRDEEGSKALQYVPGTAIDSVEATYAANRAMWDAAKLLDRRFPSAMPSAKADDKAAVAQRTQELQKGKLTLNGDTATLVAGQRPPLYLVQVDGFWKVDIAQTLQIDPTFQHTTKMAALRTIYEQLAGELEEGKFASRTEYEAEEVRLLNEISK